MDLQQKIKARFPYLPDEKFQHLLGLGELRILNPGEVFIAAGSRSTLAGLVVEGLLRNYIINDNGEQTTVVFATEMQAIAPYTPVFLNRPASETTEAVEQSLLFVIDFNVFRQAAKDDIDYAQIYTDILQSGFVAAIERIEDFTQKNPEQRYRRLLEIHGHLIERVPLKYLASYLGITAVSLSRIRKRLSKNRN